MQREALRAPGERMQREALRTRDPSYVSRRDALTQGEHAVKSHYERVSDPSRSPTTPHQRRKGYAYPLKNYHNRIKSMLLSCFSHGVRHHLDLACGRGGDIQKWDRARIGHVCALDISKNEIHEARSRYASIRPYTTKCTFVQTDRLTHDPIPFETRFDTISCMFAMHYFTHSKKALRRVFKTVSDSLREGGVFYGITTNGHAITSKLRNRPYWNMGSICIRKSRDPRSYTFTIKDTVVDRDGHVETYVFPEHLRREALRFGLVPYTIETGEDSKWFQTPIHQTWWRPLKASYRGPRDLQRATETYACFAFQKKVGAPPPSL